MSINSTQSHSGEHLVYGQIFVCNPEISLENIDIQGVGIYKIMHHHAACLIFHLLSYSFKFLF